MVCKYIYACKYLHTLLPSKVKKSKECSNEKGMTQVGCAKFRRIWKARKKQVERECVCVVLTKRVHRENEVFNRKQYDDDGKKIKSKFKERLGLGIDSDRGVQRKFEEKQATTAQQHPEGHTRHDASSSRSRTWRLERKKGAVKRHLVGSDSPQRIKSLSSSRRQDGRIGDVRFVLDSKQVLQ